MLAAWSELRRVFTRYPVDEVGACTGLGAAGRFWLGRGGSSWDRLSLSLSSSLSLSLTFSFPLSEGANARCGTFVEGSAFR